MTAAALWDSIWIALLASSILFGAYRALEWRWPERYMGIDQTFGLSSQETLSRFFIYRAVPFYVVSATCVVTVERVGGYVWVAVSVVWLTSIVATHGRVVAEGFARRWGEVNYGGYHLLMLVLLTGTLWVAVQTRDGWDAIVPPPAEMLAALWSGLLVAGLGGFVISVVKPRSGDAPTYGSTYLIDRALRDVGIENLDWLFHECRRTGADPVLLKALLVVEAAQRPRWFRRIERIGVRLRVAKTSGVMQMPSRRPLSDRESITAAAEEYAGVWTIRARGAAPYRHWAADLSLGWAAITTHNGDARFAANVAAVANDVLSHHAHSYFAANHRTAVLELRRYAGTFGLRGISSSRRLVGVEHLHSSGWSQIEVLAAPHSADGGWWSWEMSVNPSADRVMVIDVPSGLSMDVTLEGAEIVSVKPWSLLSGTDARSTKKWSPSRLLAATRDILRARRRNQTVFEADLVR